MKSRRRKKNPILIILLLAVLAVAGTIGGIMMFGGRFTTLPNGAKFIGKSENGQIISGTMMLEDGTEAKIDAINDTIEYSNGDFYKGDIVNGLRQGFGTMNFAATGDVYEGYFSNDKLTGNGKFIYSNGDIYEGAVVDSKKQGYGKFVYANGNVYVGYFDNDVRSGEGKFTWASGAEYEGEFANDLKNGYGIMTFEDGSRYEGYFKDDMRDGEKGLYIWPNNERYNGTFRNNLMDTREVDENGNFIVDEKGEYVHGEIAVYTFTTGRSYRGYFIEGQAVGVSIISAG